MCGDLSLSLSVCVCNPVCVCVCVCPLVVIVVVVAAAVVVFGIDRFSTRTVRSAPSTSPDGGSSSTARESTTRSRPKMYVCYKNESGGRERVVTRVWNQKDVSSARARTHICLFDDSADDDEDNGR